MSITTYNELRRRLHAKDGQLIQINKGFTLPVSGPSNSGGLSWGWTVTGIPATGAAPTAAVVPTSATVGAIGQRNKAAGRRYCAVRSIVDTLGDGQAVQSHLLVDRLSHQGGLDGNINTLQTTNLPTAALTRFTNGLGVWAAAEIYSSIGTGGNFINGVYTNSSGVGSRTFNFSFFGISGFSTQGRVAPFTMMLNDKGVKSVESVQLLTASGSVGNFGVTLYKTLGMIHYMNLGLVQTGDPLADIGPLFEVPDNACLQVLAFGIGQTATVVGAELLFFDVTD